METNVVLNVIKSAFTNVPDYIRFSEVDDYLRTTAKEVVCKLFRT